VDDEVDDEVVEVVRDEVVLLDEKIHQRTNQ
jgi:hypothetical protein